MIAKHIQSVIVGVNLLDELDTRMTYADFGRLTGIFEGTWHVRYRDTITDALNVAAAVMVFEGATEADVWRKFSRVYRARTGEPGAGFHRRWRIVQLEPATEIIG